MPRYVVGRNQTLFDIAIETTGSLFGVLDIIAESEREGVFLNGITHNIEEGDVVYYPSVSRNGYVVSQFPRPVATKGLTAKGIGFDKIGVPIPDVPTNLLDTLVFGKGMYGNTLYG